MSDRILIVDDDDDIRELLRYNLAREGFLVSTAFDGEDARKQMFDLKEYPDLMILDLMMPRLSGLDLARMLKARRETQAISILMLTARGEETDVIVGLELGADDYVVKPFSMKVLLARVRSLLRRSSGKANDLANPTASQQLHLNPDTFQASVGSTRLELTATEFRILSALSSHPGRVMTRMQIVDAARGEDYAVTDRSVDVHIVALRKKLGEAGSLIETVRGVGYRMRD